MNILKGPEDVCAVRLLYLLLTDKAGDLGNLGDMNMSMYIYIMGLHEKNALLEHRI